MWCPKCKMEYRKGVYVCADCGTELVEGTEADFCTVDICEFKVESLADRFVEYLQYSGLEQAEKTEKNNGAVFAVSVLEKQQKKAEKLFRGFLMAMKEEQEAAEMQELQEQVQETAWNADDEAVEDSEEETEYDWDAEEEPSDSEENNYIHDEEVQKQAENLLLSDEAEEDTGELLYTTTDSYVTKEEEYKDLKFSGITFILFSILGGIFLTLCQLNVLPIEYEKFVFIVIAAVFAVFFIIGIVSLVKASGVKREVPAEQEKTKEIYAYLDDVLTEDVLDAWRDDEVSDVENDLLITSHIRTSLIKQYPGESVIYLEYVADRYYGDRYVSEDTEDAWEDSAEDGELAEEDSDADTEE